MRRFTTLCTALPLVALAAGCAPQEETTVEPAPAVAEAPAATDTSDEIVPPTTASATLQPQAGGAGSGKVSFAQNAGGVDVVVEVSGLSPGTHAIHLHEGSECVGDFTSAGGHFNPAGAQHGAPGAPQHHAGDFANVEVDASGSGSASLRSTDLAIDSGPNAVVGHAFIVHEKADDLETQPTGNAGARVLCGVVEAGGMESAQDFEGAANGDTESAPVEGGTAGTATGAPATGAAGT
jgi:Cu-Zn family superoxide dismutase